MKKILYSLSALVLIVILIYIVITSLNFSKKGEGIVLGAIFPMTGGLASIGEDLRNGVNLAVEETGLDIIIEDGQADPQKSLTAGQYLVDVKKVPIIMTAFRGASLSLASNLKNKEVVILATTATTEGKTVSEGISNFFVIGAEMVSAGRIPGQYAKENNLCQRVGLISEQSDTGKDKLEGFSVGVGADKVVMTEFFQPKEIDFRTIVTKMKGKDVDCIFVEVRSDNLPFLLTNMDELNFYPKIFANSYSVTPKGIENSPKKVAENVIFSSTSLNEENKETSKFIKSYRNLYDKEPTDFSVIGYEMTKIASDLIKNCGSDKKCMEERLSSLKNYKSPLGTLTVNENNEIYLRDYELFEIKDGKFSKIKN